MSGSKQAVNFTNLAKAETASEIEICERGQDKPLIVSLVRRGSSVISLPAYNTVTNKIQRDDGISYLMNEVRATNLRQRLGTFT